MIAPDRDRAERSDRHTASHFQRSEQAEMTTASSKDPALSQETRGASDTDVAALHQEIARLHAHISELEQRCAAAENRQHAERVSSILTESAPDGVLALDLEGRVLYANPCLQRMLGHTESLVGWSESQLHPETRAADTSRSPTPPPPGFTTLLKQDGGTLPALVTRFPLRDATGARIGEALIVRDASAPVQKGTGGRHEQALLSGIINNARTVIFAKDPSGAYLMVNKRYEEIFHVKNEELLGRRDHDIFPKEIADRVVENDRQVLISRQSVELEELVPSDDGMHAYISAKFPLYDEDGQVYAICGIATDISDLKRLEKERAALQQEVLDRQQAMLRELSTPLIPLAEGVLVMPIIGAIDDLRARQILDALLTGIAEQRARTAILDITGVKGVNSVAAGALRQAAHAAKLLGAEVVLTGINAEVAQALIALDVDLGRTVTRNTLQSGIAYALRGRALSPAG